MQPEQVVKRIVNGFTEKQLKFSQLPNHTSLEEALKSIAYPSNDGTIAELCECYAYWHIHTNPRYLTKGILMNVPRIIAKALHKGEKLILIENEIKKYKIIT